MAADPEMAHFRAGVAISSFLIDQIKNIRFTNQSPQCNIFNIQASRGIGWGFRVVLGSANSDFGAVTTGLNWRLL
jgi:hypothetical protein